MNKSNGNNQSIRFSDFSINTKKDNTEKIDKFPEMTIDDDMEVKLFNGYPILDELIVDSNSDKFEIKKWKNLSSKNKNYYLFNKIEYYKHLKIIKEKNNNELEKKINEKNINLSKLKDEIQNKEEEHQKIKKLLNFKQNEDDKSQQINKNDDKDIYIQKLKEYPIKIANLDKKIHEVEKIINNYQSKNGNSLDTIIKGLKEEKRRITKEKEIQTKIIQNFHINIQDIKESIRILEIKNTKK